MPNELKKSEDPDWVSQEPSSSINLGVGQKGLGEWRNYGNLR